MLPAPAEATCPRHPGAPALFTCERCGAFACDACSPTGLGGRWHRCTPERQDPALAPPTRTKIATVGLWLGAASLVPCLGVYFFLGAIACGAVSLNYEPEQRSRAWAAIAMGVLSLVGHLGVIAVLVLRKG